MGARPLSRVIQEHIKKPLADEVLFGKLTSGGTVRVLLGKDEQGLDELKFTYPVARRGKGAAQARCAQVVATAQETSCKEAAKHSPATKAAAKKKKAGGGPKGQEGKREVTGDQPNTR